MGAGHSHALYIHDHSPIHRLAPETKLLAAFGFAICVALTPREAVWSFAAYAVMVVSLTVLARVPPGFLLLRLTAVVPFVIFALFIPFIASGERIEVWGVEVSVQGLWGMWNILAKAVLGASASILLTATTEIPDILRGLGVLRVPALFTSIAMFMVRYLELIADELRRTRVAMTSRGYDPRWLWQARPIASSAGALFVRSYERGERVHEAMLARGFTGTMPALGHPQAVAREWVLVSGWLVISAAVATIALVTS